eukprot:Rmarinus@m.13336
MGLKGKKGILEIDVGGDLSSSFTLSQSGRSLQLGPGTGYVIGQNGIKSSPLSAQQKPDTDVMGADELQLSDLSFVKVLGRGVTGPVHLAVHTPTDRKMAIKVLPIVDQAQRHQLMKELAAMTELANPHFVALHGAFYDRDAVYLALEFMDTGSLADLAKDAGPMPEPVIASIAVEILLGLQFMHKKHMIHRDLKPGNILLNSEGGVKIADFGESVSLSQTLATAGSWVGTMSYMSPERIQ